MAFAIGKIVIIPLRAPIVQVVNIPILNTVNVQIVPRENIRPLTRIIASNVQPGNGQLLLKHRPFRHVFHALLENLAHCWGQKKKVIVKIVKLARTMTRKVVTMAQVVWNVRLENIPRAVKVERFHVINAWLGISTSKENQLIHAILALWGFFNQVMDRLNAMLVFPVHLTRILVLVPVWNAPSVFLKAPKVKQNASFARKDVTNQIKVRQPV